MSDTSPEARPTASELVDRAAALRPLLERNGDETDRLRRVAEENVEAIRNAGLCRILEPRRFGGYEGDFRTLLEVMAELGKGCGSTSWAMSLINVCAWLVGLYPERAQSEVWGTDPDAWIAGSLAPNGEARKVEGGVVVSGRWPWASGCLHAQWGVGGLRVLDEAGEILDFGLGLMPMSELEIEDTWFMVGMRGTGSNTIVAESAGFQIQLAEAAMKIDSAYLHAFRAAGDLDDAAASGDYPDPLTRARVRLDTAQVARMCREAVEILTAAHGTSSLADASRLQRIWRDQYVASRHAIISWVVNLEIYGKALLGIEPNITELI